MEEFSKEFEEKLNVISITYGRFLSNLEFLIQNTSNTFNAESLIVCLAIVG